MKNTKRQGTKERECAQPQGSNFPFQLKGWTLRPYHEGKQTTGSRKKTGWARFALCQQNHKGNCASKPIGRWPWKTDLTCLGWLFCTDENMQQKGPRLLTDLAWINRYMTTSDSTLSVMKERQLDVLSSLSRNQRPFSEPWTQWSLIGYVKFLWLEHTGAFLQIYTVTHGVASALIQLFSLLRVPGKLLTNQEDKLYV